MDDENGTLAESAAGVLRAVEDVLRTQLSGEHRYTQSFWEDVQAFAHAIDWRKDTWIWMLFMVELIDLICIFLSRRSWERLSVIFMANTCCLAAAETLNRLAGQHWMAFSSQDYFDSSGVFASIMLGLPLLLCQFVIVGFLLREAASMVIRVKRLELKQKAREKREEKAKEE
ncbi:Transmembrane protein 18 [Symbiodinium microadriaticum]|uniref:Transmembrane protein 18 n=1 Tax=Symbiodinium microadriaticum TaxID=2951 RepID=A0A1Q9EIG6_SYMMI|nr:Transmembrane protein 18 [Symbiodinium microadriaticum]|mmetsp:Transcript_136353/g.322986  ORF Transcript_136353/g.322986 Transcript_136353/m.322986 type:complete len:172 (+) Transcript_136353:43-558(+)